MTECSSIEVEPAPAPLSIISVSTMQTIYPMPSPVIDDLDDLESLLVAMKFEM